MLSNLLLTLVPGLAPLPVPATPVPCYQEGQDAAAQIAAAGEDVGKLEALAATFKEAGNGASARLVYVRVLELDPDHEAAHKALGHHFYDDQWFTTYSALSKYRSAEAKRMKEEFGLVRHNKEWVPETDLPFIRMGWVKDGDEYVHPAVLKRRKDRETLTAEGFQQRPEDSLWIDPAEFEKWSGGLFKIGDEWVSEADANAYHSKIGQWWKYRGEHYVAYTTCNREACAWVVWWADKTYDDLVRLFGVEPEEKPVFACLSSLQQYNTFAAGNQSNQPPTESDGFSSCHFAYLADTWFDVSNPQAPEYLGGGVGFYDVNDEAMKGWGQFSIRHAAGLSYAESIDRAWGAISQAIANQGGGGGSGPMWQEKRIPRWLVYGGASYVERYAANKDATEEQGGPWAVRAWSLEQIKNTGPLKPLDQVFAMRLDVNDLDGAGRLINQAGLVTAFVLDGECEPVTRAHKAFRDAMLAGEDTKPSVTGLQKAIADNSEAFMAFAGIEPAPAGGAAAGGGGE